MSKWKTQNGSPVLSNENGQGHKKKYELVTINKVIWDYLLFYKITITVEYLLGGDECRSRQRIHGFRRFK